MTLKRHAGSSHLLATIVLLVAFGHSSGQVELRSDTISVTKADTTFQITLEGYLDADNTFTYPSTQVFQPMSRLVLRNAGDTVVTHPRLVFNDERKWFDHQSMQSEVFSSATTDKERSLALWKFVRDNRRHAREPQPGDEVNDPVRLFGVYGYGMCYNSNFANAFLSKGLLQDYNSFSNRGGRHFVTQMSFGGQFMLIDSDLETFYLKSDNETIASYDDVVMDRNLIKRSQHYGKYWRFLQHSKFIAYSIYLPNEKRYNFGMMKNFHSLDFSLRPGESIVYDWAPASLYHSYGTGAPSDTTIIANGKFIYATNFNNAALDNLVDGHDGVTTFRYDSISPNLHAVATGDTTSIVVTVTSPFVVVDGTVAGKFLRTVPEDQLRMYFSRDSVDWTLAWEATQTGEFEDTVRLDSHIATLSTFALYKYHLKFELLAKDTIANAGIDSLVIVTDFQASRSFLPQLKLGDNTVHYSDQSGDVRDVVVTLEWSESQENPPPGQVTTPLFPPDGAEIDSLKFTFEWTPAIDTTDEIVDYEFLLSDRADMKYPLSPSFELYTQTADSTKLNHFEIPFDGMLNSGSTYYWKVRAKDSRGAWGAWSPVWSFVPHGPHPPVNGNTSISNDTLTVSWDAAVVGTDVARYELHGSHETLGFTPDTTTLITDTLSTNVFKMLYDVTVASPFYRVIAIDANGARSAPSEVIHLPAAYSIDLPDTVRLDSLVQIQIPRIPTYYVDAIEWIGDSFFYFPVDSPEKVEVLEMPAWLSYDSVLHTVNATPSLEELYATKKDSSAFVRVRTTDLLSGQVNELTYHFNIELPPNNSPIISDFDSVAYAGVEFSREIQVDESDLGDRIVLAEIVSKPSWMTALVSTTNNVVSLSGVPGIEHAGDTVLTVRASDIYGPFERTYTITVVDTIPIAITGLSQYEGLRKIPFTSAVQTSRPAVSYELVSAPGWLQLDETTGVLSGIPLKIYQSGSRKVVVRATGTNGLSAEAEFTIFIKITNTPPVLSQIDTVAYVGTNYAADIYIRDVDFSFGDSVRLVETIETPPWMLTSHVDGDSTIHLSGALGNEHEGTSTLTLRVADSFDTVLVNYQFLVLDTITSLPIVVSNQTAVENSTFQAQVAPAAEVEVMELVDPPHWLNIDPVTGVLYGTPGPEDVGEITVIIRITTTTGKSYDEIIPITVIPASVVSLSGTESICRGDVATVVFRHDGQSPWNLTYSKGGEVITVSGIESETYAVDVMPWVDTNIVLMSASTWTGPSVVSGESQIVIRVGQPAVKELQHFAARVERRFEFPILVDNPCDTPIEFVLQTAPPWLRIDPHNGIIHGVPPRGSVGEVQASVSISDQFGLISSRQVKFDITPMPVALLHDSGEHRMCRGDSLEVMIEFTGLPPWSLTVYDGDGHFSIVTSTTPYTFTAKPKRDGKIRLAHFSDQLSDGKIPHPIISYTLVDTRGLLVRPNPVANEGTIDIVVCRPGPVVVDIYNSMGQLVARLLDEVITDDSLSVQWLPEGVPSGIYFVVMKVTDGPDVRYSTERILHVN